MPIFLVQTSQIVLVQELLANVVDPSQTLWVWVTSLLTRMAADGEIPAMPTPTYGKIMSLADKAARCDCWDLEYVGICGIPSGNFKGRNDCQPSNFGAPHFSRKSIYIYIGKFHGDHKALKGRMTCHEES